MQLFTNITNNITDIYIIYFINAEDWNINASSLATQEAGTTTAQAAARKLSCAGCGDWRICLR